MTVARLRAEHGEVIRLKGVVGLLRQDQIELARLSAAQTERDRVEQTGHAQTNELRTVEEKIQKAMEELAGTTLKSGMAISPFVLAFTTVLR